MAAGPIGAADYYGTTPNSSVATHVHIIYLFIHVLLLFFFSSTRLSSTCSQAGPGQRRRRCHVAKIISRRCYHVAGAIYFKLWRSRVAPRHHAGHNNQLDSQIGWRWMGMGRWWPGVDRIGWRFHVAVSGDVHAVYTDAYRPRTDREEGRREWW